MRPALLPSTPVFLALLALLLVACAAPGEGPVAPPDRIQTSRVAEAIVVTLSVDPGEYPGTLRAETEFEDLSRNQLLWTHRLNHVLLVDDATGRVQGVAAVIPQSVDDTVHVVEYDLRAFPALLAYLALPFVPADSSSIRMILDDFKEQPEVAEVAEVLAAMVAQTREHPFVLPEAELTRLSQMLRRYLPAEAGPKADGVERIGGILEGAALDVTSYGPIDSYSYEVDFTARNYEPIYKWATLADLNGQEVVGVLLEPWFPVPDLNLMSIWERVKTMAESVINLDMDHGITTTEDFTVHIFGPAEGEWTFTVSTSSLKAQFATIYFIPAKVLDSIGISFAGDRAMLDKVLKDPKFISDNAPLVRRLVDDLGDTDALMELTANLAMFMTKHYVNSVEKTALLNLDFGDDFTALYKAVSSAIKLGKGATTSLYTALTGALNRPDVVLPLPILDLCDASSLYSDGTCHVYCSDPDPDCEGEVMTGDTLPPDGEFLQPSGDVTVEADVLLVSGLATDDFGLETLTVRLKDLDGDTLWEWPIDAQGATSFQHTWEIPIAAMGPGTYRLQLRVEDQAGHVVFQNAPGHVTLVAGPSPASETPMAFLHKPLDGSTVDTHLEVVGECRAPALLASCDVVIISEATGDEMDGLKDEKKGAAGWLERVFDTSDYPPGDYFVTFASMPADGSPSLFDTATVHVAHATPSVPAPVGSFSSPSEGELVTGPFDVAATVVAAETLEKVTVLVDALGATGGSTERLEFFPSSTSFTVDVQLDTAFWQPGTYAITVWARDSHQAVVIDQILVTYLSEASGSTTLLPLMPFPGGAGYGVTQSWSSLHNSSCLGVHAGALKYGIDFNQAGSADCGDPVLAVGPGTVTFASGAYNGGWGGLVVIDHGDGLYSRYAHLAYGSIQVSVGQTVCTGLHLGNLDTTGFSTGCHLHFQFDSKGGLSGSSVSFDGFAETNGIPVCGGWYISQNTMRTACTTTAPPTGSITSPTADTSVSEVLVVQATVTDDVVLEKVTLLLDEQGASGGSVLSKSWIPGTAAHTIDETFDVTDWYPGKYYVTVWAYDGDNPAQVIEQTSFWIPPVAGDDSPMGYFTSPQAGEVVAGSFVVSALVTDDVALEKVTLLVDPEGSAGGTADKFEFTPEAKSFGLQQLVSTTTWTSGNYFLALWASDGVNQPLVVDQQTIVFDGEPGPDPTDSPAAGFIAAPDDGSTLIGAFTVAGSASDADGLAKVTIALNWDTGNHNVAVCEGNCSGADFAVNRSIDPATYGVSNGLLTIALWTLDNDGHTGGPFAARTISWSASMPTDSPATGSISSPSNGSTLAGAFAVMGSASDADGLAKATIALNWDTGNANVAVCDGNCGGSSYAVNKSVNPANYGVPNGPLTIALWTLDNNGHTGGPFAARTISWSSGTPTDLPATGNITAPADGANEAGSFVVTGSASDADGLAKVTIALNWDTGNENVAVCDGNCGGSSYAVNKSINPANYGVPSGPLTLALWTLDSNGIGGGPFAPTTVIWSTVDSPASGSISQPTEYSSQLGSFTVIGSASDADGLAKVTIALNWDAGNENVAVCDGNCGGSSYAVNKGINPTNYGVPSGPLTLALWTLDGNGIGGGPFAPRTINWSKVDAPASANISQPAAGSSQSGSFTVSGSASDADGLAKVTIALNWNGGNENIVVCDGNCGGSSYAVNKSINPATYGVPSGSQLTVALWTRDNDDNTSGPFSATTFTWNLSFHTSPKCPSTTTAASYSCPGGIVMNICGFVDTSGNVTVTASKDAGMVGPGTYVVRVFDDALAGSTQCKGGNVDKATFINTGDKPAITFTSFPSLLTGPGKKTYCVTKAAGDDDAYYCSGKLTLTGN